MIELQVREQFGLAEPSTSKEDMTSELRVDARAGIHRGKQEGRAMQRKLKTGGSEARLYPPCYHLSRERLGTDCSTVKTDNPLKEILF